MRDALDLRLLPSYLAMAMQAVTKAYPFYWPAFELGQSDQNEVQSCQSLFPAFHRAYDWHSCVHGFWSIARCIRLAPLSAQAEKGRSLLQIELTVEKISGEIKTLERSEYQSFERPYGLAWVCKLAAELFLHQPEQWHAVEPLALLSSQRVLAWHRRLTYPLQTGEHSQSAFALALIKDFAHTVGAKQLFDDINGEIERLYAGKSRSIIHAEPSGHDFLSPSLGRAMIVGELLPQSAFAEWLTHYIPELGQDAAWLPVVRGYDASDGKLSHLIGLNLSRSWMLKRIAAKLSSADPRTAMLQKTAVTHADQGHKAISTEHFASSHWLASFALLDLADLSCY